MDLRVCRQVDDGAKIVVQTLEGLERLEHIDQLDRTKDVRVFRSDLDYYLEVLTHVDLEHLLHTCERLLRCEATEIIYEPLEPRQSVLIRCLPKSTGERHTHR